MHRMNKEEKQFWDQMKRGIDEMSEEDRLKEAKMIDAWCA